MIQPILVYGHEKLRMRSENFPKDTDLSKIINDLLDTLDSTSGIGLSAPQIGINKQIFVIKYNDKRINFNEVFINPNITAFSGKVFFIEEGCLSIPKLSGPVARLDKIKIQYYDREWKFHEKEYSGIISRIIQHENDHLLGKMWVDYLGFVERSSIQQDLELIKTRKINVNYSII